MVRGRSIVDVITVSENVSPDLPDLSNVSTSLHDSIRLEYFTEMRNLEVRLLLFTVAS